MTKAAFAKTLSGTLEPLDAAAKDFMERLRPGAVAKVEVSRARNPRRFRLFWGLVKICQDNSPQNLSKEAWADLLKVLGGHVEIARRKNGEVLQLPKSIAFASMPESEFAEFINRLMHAIRTEVIPGLDEGALRRELEAISQMEEAA